MVYTRTRFRRRANIRNLYRRSKMRRLTRRQKSNGIYRGFVRGRARPEVKWAEARWNQDINSGTKFSNSASIISLDQGTTAHTRIGNQVRVFKNEINLYIVDNSGQTGPTAPSKASYKCRCVFWTPKNNQNEATTWINNNLGMATIVDSNQIYVMKDYYINLSPSYLGDLTTSDPSGGPRDFSAIRKHKFKFPRKVYFGDNDNTFNVDKNILYLTIMVENWTGVGIRVNAYIKTFYYDT